MTVKMKVINYATLGMGHKPIHYLMYHLLALLLTLHAEIQCLHPNPYFLKDPKGHAPDQGPFLNAGLVPVLHIPDRDQGRPVVDPLQDLVAITSPATVDTEHTEVLPYVEDRGPDHRAVADPDMTAMRNISMKG